MSDTETVEVNFDVIQHETDLAILLLIDDDEVWVPRSVVADLDEDRGFITVEEWWAVKKGLV